MSIRTRYAYPGIIIAAALIAPTLVASPAFALDVPAALAAPAPSTTLPSSYPHQEDLFEFPDNPADASIARGAIPYDEIAPKLNDWTGESDIISTQVVGKSANKWDLYLVTITAPETTAETAKQEAWKDEIKYDSASAAKDEELAEDYKRPIWFNGNIHGNEWEGTDASLNYIEYLLKNENTSYVQNLLQNYRLYFTVSNNPDGRIIGQRPNGQNFDLNRDFVTSTTPETTLIKDLTAEIQPIFFIDLHGYTGVLQVEPCGPPHGENYDYDLFIPHAYAAALKIEEDVVAAGIAGNTYRDKVTGATSTTKTDTSGIIIPFRDTPSGWDDWPPVFTAQYVAYQGAISYTVELPLGRVTSPTTSAANSAIDTKVAVTVIGSTLDYITENDDAILDNQIEIFRRGEAGEPLKKINTPVDTSNFTGPTQWAAIWGADDAQGHDDATGATFPRAYVIPTGAGQKSDSDAAYLVNYLMTHGLKVKKSLAPLTVGSTTYPSGSYIVDMHQPLRGLVNALLASGSDISGWVPSMYDISAWSQGFLWGATVDRVGNTLDPALDVATVDITKADPTGSVPGGTKYLTFSLDGVDDFRGLNYLLSNNVPVTMVGTNKAIVGNDAATYAAVAVASSDYGIAFATTSGSELKGTNTKPLKKLNIAYTGTQDDFYSLQQMGFATSQLTLVSAALLQAGTVDLANVDVLWLGAALVPNASTQPAAVTAIQAYVASGKGVVGRGTGANTFANTYYDLGSTAVSGNSSGNGIVNLTVPEGSALGGLGTRYGFVYPAVSFALGAGHGKVEQTYSTTNTLIAGHWRQTTATNGPAYAAGRASVVSSTLDSGAKAMVFGTSVVFRTHTKGHFSEVATGLYWAAKPSTGATVPVPAETSTALTLSSESGVFGGTPTEAVIKVTADASVPSVRGTVEILAGTTVVATTTVNKFGNGKVALPTNLPVGTTSLVASFSPGEGLALSPSTSPAVAYELTKATTATALTLSAPTQVFGQDPAATATVEVTLVDGSAPLTGTVSLEADGEEIDSTDVAEGTVSFVLPKSLAVGDHAITATFVPATGTPVLGSDSAASTLTVDPAPPVIPEKVDPVVTVVAKGASYGKSASATVTVARDSAAAEGTVAIEVDGKAFGVATLVAGSTTITLPNTLAAGSHTVTALYLGNDTTTTGAKSALVTIAKAPTTVSGVLSSRAPIVKKSTLTLKITVKTPGAAVDIQGGIRVFVNGATVKSFTLSKAADGKITVKLPKFTKKGANTVKIAFGGTSNLAPSVSPIYKVTAKS